MKRFLVVGLIVIDAMFAFMIVTGRSNANILPIEKVQIEKVWAMPQQDRVYKKMSDVDYQKIIDITKTLKLEWQRFALEAIPQIIREHGSYIQEIADEFDLLPHILIGGVIVESSGNPYAVSKKGAQGCMQVMPKTMEDLKTKGDPFNCRNSIRQGAEYLAQLRDRYGYKDTSMMLAAYLYGPDGVKSKTAEELAQDEYIKKMLFVMFHVHLMHNMLRTYHARNA